ncbi:hypothetical protein HGRIS_008194 [Hohenbuehelia grisea]|uniref:protein-ribulosamine 3-kinase n=1 Tax=Hohenbuehelia grisea TaxID=104357 RepID=A0ABR3J796_9AGAR
MSIPSIILSELQHLELDAEFSGSLPRIRSSSGRVYFAKLGSSRDAEQWAGEAASLKDMHAAARGLAPHLLSFGIANNSSPYFISEYKDIGRLSDGTARTLATRLASELHVHTSRKGFGFEIPTYCGATRLKNGWFNTWSECYASMLRDMVSQLRKGRGHPELCNKTDEVIETVIPKLLGPLQVQPVLLHGDLWSGNVGVDQATGEPVIYDPASYYGHNEADLGIARMFGGFPDSFFIEYHQIIPKSEPVEQYELRAELYEFFHHLNHTLLFGGSYARSAISKLDKLISANL